MQLEQQLKLFNQALKTIVAAGSDVEWSKSDVVRVAEKALTDIKEKRESFNLDFVKAENSENN